MADEAVVLKPVSFNPFKTEPQKVALTEAELSADAADARTPASKDELLREMGRKDLAPGARAILEQHYKSTFGEEPGGQVNVNRGAQIAAERRRGPKPVFPLEGEKKASVELRPVDFDPFAAAPAPPSKLSDVGHGLKVGADVAAQDVRELVGRVPGIGPSIVSALDKVDELVTGKSSEALLKGDIESQTKAMSPEQQAAGQKRWDTLEQDSAWRDWRAYTGALAQSIPEQAVTMFPAMRLAKGAYAVSIAKGATQKVAGEAAARTATVAGAALEGSLGGAQSSRQVRDDILALKEPELQDSEALKSMMATGLSFDQARAQLADDAATKAFFLSGVATGIFGGMGDRVLAKAMTGQLAGGMVKRAAKGAVAEGVLEELPQSALQQASQNVAMQAAVPSTEVTKDVANQALGGLAVGALQGGAQTALLGRASAPQEAGAAAAPAPPSPAAGAAPAPPATGATPPPATPSSDATAAPPPPATPSSDATAAPPPLAPIDQARADAQVLKSGGDLTGADEARTKNATLIAVYGENAAVRHVIETPGQFAALGDAMLMAAPTVERVRGTIKQGQESRDVTPEILGAIDELSRIKASGQSVAQVMAHGVAHDISYEGQQLIQFLDENATNPKRVAAFLETYLQSVEDASGIPSKVRGRAFDILQEQQLSRKKADEEKALEQRTQAERADAEKLKKVRNKVAMIRAETALADLKVKAAKPVGQTAMEAAFERARTLKGKVRAKPSAESDGAVPPRAPSAAAPGPAKDAGPAARSAGAVPEPAQADHGGHARPVRAGSDQEGAQAGVNRGAKIAGELAKGDGTRENPVIVSRPKHITAAAARAAEQPSAAQKEANNHAKGHFRFEEKNPLSKLGVISIETAKGNERVAKDGKWSVPNMPAHYGHLQIAEGADGDKADVTIGDDLNAKHVYVIDQIDPATKKFDETKSMVGFTSQKAAEAVYVKSFTDGKGKARMGAITEMTPAQYVARAQSNGLKEAVAYKQPVEAAPFQARKGSAFLQAIRKAGGISPKESADLMGDDAMVLNRRLPGISRNGGMSGDGLVEWMVDNGYLTQHAVERADANDPGGSIELAYGLIRRALADEDVVPMRDEHAAMQRQAEEEGRRGEEEHADRMASDPRYRADYETVAPVVADLAGELQGDWSTMTEEQKDAKLDSLFGADSRPKPVASATEVGAGTPAQETGRPSLELQGQTPAEVAAQAAQAAAQAAQSAAESVKAAVDEMRSAFTLTGSNRTADEGAARGQRDLLQREPGQDDDGRGAFSRAKTPVFVSELERRVAGLKQGAAPAAQWKSTIKAMPGVKADEIEWSGINDWLEMQPGKVTKESVLDYLRENGVKVEETVLGDPEGVAAATQENDVLVVELDSIGYAIETAPSDVTGGLVIDGLTHRASHALWGFEQGVGFVDASGEKDIELPERVQQIGLRLAELEQEMPTAETGGDEGNTRYSKYTLPGGKNYRELLLTLPERRGQEKFDPEKVEIKRDLRSVTQGSTTIFYDGKQLATYGDDPQLQPGGGYKQRPDSHWMKVAKSVFENGDTRNSISSRAGAFRSSHFEQSNILAHIRFDERTDAEGKKVLFIEEVQSDWAQKGKREGFKDDAEKRFIVLKEKTEKKYGMSLVDVRNSSRSEEKMRDLDAIDQAYKEAQQEKHGSRVPPAPFVGKTEAWVSLALKRMIRYAAENGFDRVAWTTGAQQADRYDMRHHVEKVMAFRRDDGKYDFMVTPKGGRSHKDINAVEPTKLADTVGKDLAAKIEKQGKGWQTYEDVDLQVGGEGMLAFYDKLLPNIANDVLKKVGGVRVVSSAILGDLTRQEAARRVYGENYESLPPESQARARGVEEGNLLTQPGFDITPKMREQAMAGLPMFSRQADNIADYKFEQKPARSGQPLFWNAHIGLGIARLETNRGHGERTVGYGVYDAKARDETGQPTKLGTLRVDLDARGKFSALRLIEIRKDSRQKGLGWGETVIASLLQHNGAIPMRIIDIQHHTSDDWDALPFWRKMGTRFDNYSTDPNVQIDGTLTLKDYLQARAEKGKFLRDARPLEASENLSPGAQPAGAPTRAEGTRTGEPQAEQPNTGGNERGPGRRAGVAGRDEGVGLTPSAIRQAIEPILSKWGNAPEVHVIQSMAEAPQAMRLLDNAMRSTGASGDPEAFIHRNAVYLVADGLTPDRVFTALFHESLGHFGLRGTFGEKLNPILDRVSFDFKDRVAAKAKQYGLDVANAGQRRQAAEEVLAELAQTRPQHSLVKRLIAAIRQFLRELGLDLKLSDADVVANYIAPARGFVERGRMQVSVEPVPAFSRAVAANIPGAVFSSARQMFDTVTRSDRVLNRVISKFNTPFHIAETHPEFKPVYEEAQDYNQDVSRVANETADLAPDLLPRIESFSDFKKSAPSNEDIAATADALYAGTLWGGGSPMEGRAWTDAELRSGRARDANGVTIDAFTPLTDPQIKLYRQALASVGHSLTEHAKSLVWRLAKQKGIRLSHGSASLANMVAVADNNAAMQALGKTDALRGADDEATVLLKGEIAELDAFRQALQDIKEKTEGLIAHGYFPAMRFGQYAVNVQTLDENGKWKEEFFGRYETQTAANLAKEELLKEYPLPTSRVTSGVMNDDAHKLFQGLNLDALELFSEHMRDDSGKPISADPIMQEYFRVAVTERSTLKRQIHRKGTPGFSRDVPRALAQFTVSNATSASRNYHAADMLQKVQKIRAGDLQAYATRYVRYLQDPQEESPALRGFLANYYILGSIAFGAVNMTQPILMTAPYLTQHTSWTNAMGQLGRAAKDLVTGRKDLSEEEKAAYAKAAKAGIVSPQEIHQIRAESRASMMGDSPLWQKLESVLGAKGITLPGKLLMRKAAFLWGSVYAMTEQFNRGTTFLAAYRIGKANNVDAYAFAKNAVDATQGVYARSNRPEVSRGAVGATIMTFKQFSIAYLELAKRLYDTDKKAFAVLMLTLIALAGAEGLPFAEDIEDLIDTIGQWAGYPTNAKKALRKQAVDILGQDLADILLHGASAIPGVPIDVANRMGMHNIIPGSALLKTSEPDKTRDIIDLLGPAAGLFKNAGTAVEGLATGKPGDTKLLLPSAIQNVLKASEMVDTGTYRDTKGRKVMDVDAVDAFAKLIGFQPAKVARETRLVGQNQQDIALHRVIEDSIAGKWARGIADKDAGMVADAVKLWKDWNSTNPEMPVAITASQIASRIKELQMSREQRFVKSAPREIRGDVQRDLRQ